jgi:hypothetical protein
VRVLPRLLHAARQSGLVLFRKPAVIGLTGGTRCTVYSGCGCDRSRSRSHRSGGGLQNAFRSLRGLAGLFVFAHDTQMSNSNASSLKASRSCLREKFLRALRGFRAGEALVLRAQAADIFLDVRKHIEAQYGRGDEGGIAKSNAGFF